MDGSAAPFLVLVEEAGLRSQAVPRKVLKIVKPFRYQSQGKSMSAEPGTQFSVSYEIHFDHPLIRSQRKTVVLDSTGYENQIAPARTFGFLKDVNYLKSKGLIRGGSLENAVVLDGDRILNESLRFKDEFVSHKILDMVGDLAIGGYRLQGHFRAEKAGHEVHALFLKALLAADDCYRIVTEKAETEAAVPATSVTESFAGAGL